MKKLAGDECAFRRSDELDSQVLSYVSAKKRFLIRGFSLSLALVAGSIPTHWLCPASTPPVSGILAVLGAAIFSSTCLGAFRLKRVRCPSCGKNTELRGRHTGQGGDEEVIAICPSCEVQCPTGMVISG
ncbi:hypothetical protein [Prosthecobacter sp.]|jgi:hypothetical protein|uniref:hypothetical protein n=1 Tax=Prosthecobacter sp. TaxID=1965333 RepID=UPI0037C9452C